MKKIYGSYLTSTKARKAVDELLQQGYTRDEIKVVSNSDLGRDLNYLEDDVEKDDRSLWEKIKGAFTFDEYDDEYWNKDLDSSERSLLEGYRTNLQAGEIIVLVEEGASLYRDTFRDGVPDWDERENEFNEDLEYNSQVNVDTSRIDESSINNMDKDKL
ncbi:general stress protein [Tissierella creatinophila]|uniref:Heat induced stress protein YflT n=1 Tax=Tissierella creatinophila DSM 6911 TaxID=1123403 RepID=A0A1U7M7V2_TISCR|nr:general stress protein [Tissierella creatinophila]OLS03414.1 heat induced stress protein YflT [Tissierella creatinophila DSM 6911]